MNDPSRDPELMNRSGGSRYKQGLYLQGCGGFCFLLSSVPTVIFVVLRGSHNLIVPMKCFTYP